MADSKLVQTQAVTLLVAHLSDYLPGSSPSKSTYTFATAATQAGVGQFWILTGSKKPALTELFERTLAHQSRSFCPLVENIVRNGLKYRAFKQNPLTRQDIERLNGLVAKVGFKIPELWDSSFLASLPDAPGEQVVQPAPSPVSVPTSSSQKREEDLAKLRPRLHDLVSSTDRQAAGYQLEELLNSLFKTFGLDPRAGFRVVGEQIDGSFLLDGEVYLLEAKWEKTATDAKELYAFRMKIEGKSAFTRGLFLSMNGFTPDATESLTRGKQPLFILMTGVDLFDVVGGQVALDDLLRGKTRHLAETGDPNISSRALYERAAQRP